jgi:hypothetical protein
MALTATLIAFASGLAAQVKAPPAPSASTARPMGRSMQLDNEVERLDRALAVQKSLVEHWKSEACELGSRAIQLRIERDALRVRLETVSQAAHLRAMQALQAQQAAVQPNPALQAQANALNQQAQTLGGQSLLGAQNLQLPAHWDCTCIPDRATALRRR